MSADISLAETIERITAHCAKHERSGRAQFSVDGIRRLLEHIAEQREHIRKQAEDIMTLGKLVYASEHETWRSRAESCAIMLAEALNELDAALARPTQEPQHE
jgi:hypothetical protein